MFLSSLSNMEIICSLKVWKNSPVAVLEGITINFGISLRVGSHLKFLSYFVRMRSLDNYFFSKDLIFPSWLYFIEVKFFLVLLKKSERWLWWWGEVSQYFSPGGCLHIFRVKAPYQWWTGSLRSLHFSDDEAEG